MRYYTTVRIELMAKSDKEALEDSKMIEDRIRGLDGVNGGERIYVTKQDGLECTDLLK